jgi:hypothetical protein
MAGAASLRLETTVPGIWSGAHDDGIAAQDLVVLTRA